MVCDGDGEIVLTAPTSATLPARLVENCIHPVLSSWFGPCLHVLVIQCLLAGMYFFARHSAVDGSLLAAC